MRKSTQTTPTTQNSAPDGIYLNGTCVGRTRRMVGENASKELITYKIQTQDNLFYVKDWDANGNYFSIGESVQIPLKIQPYTSKGTTRVDFTYYRTYDMDF
jgi:hypothetical protein